VLSLEQGLTILLYIGLHNCDFLVEGKKLRRL